MKIENDASKIEVRAWLKEGNVSMCSQWFKIVDFDPNNGYSQFDWSDGTYLCLNEVVFEDLDWEYRLII